MKDKPLKWCKHFKHMKISSDKPQWPDGNKEWYLWGDGKMVLFPIPNFCPDCGKKRPT